LSSVALVCLLFGAAFATLGVSVAFLRRARRRAAPPPRPRPSPPPVPPLAAAPATRRTQAPVGARGSLDGGGALAVAAPAPTKVGCPSCRRDFAPGLRYCPYDARRLVPIAELAERSRVQGSVCPRCRRAFDPGIRYCTHDAEELMSASLWEATRGRRPEPALTGVVGKICPRCAGRYDLATTYCGRDGAELVTIN
jgi:hypothetical protein